MEYVTITSTKLLGLWGGLFFFGMFSTVTFAAYLDLRQRLKPFIKEYHKMKKKNKTLRKLLTQYKKGYNIDIKS